MHVKYMACCGAKEMNGLVAFTKRPKEALAAFVKGCKDTEQNYGPNHKESPLIVFTGVTESRRGTTMTYATGFASYIRKHKLGKVQGSSPKVNPNSGNIIRAWLWEPDYPAIYAHLGTTGK